MGEPLPEDLEEADEPPHIEADEYGEHPPSEASAAAAVSALQAAFSANIG